MEFAQGCIALRGILDRPCNAFLNSVFGLIEILLLHQNFATQIQNTALVRIGRIRFVQQLRARSPNRVAEMPAAPVRIATFAYALVSRGPFRRAEVNSRAARVWPAGFSSQPTSYSDSAKSLFSCG